MNTFTRAVGLLVASVLALPACTQSKIEPVKYPFLWRIEGEPASFLYGTIHLPDRRVTELPAAVERALDACDVLLTEIELTAAVQLEAAKASTLPKGTTLADVLPKELYERLDAYLRSKRTSIDMMQQMKPWVVMATLPLLDDMKALLGGTPLDKKLVLEAKSRDKATGAIETLQEQLGVFESFTQQEQVLLLEATLGTLERAAKDGRRLLEELVQAYLSGDLAALERLLDETSGLDSVPDLKDRLEKQILTDRNHHMAERIALKVRAEPRQSYFFAVGAAHYPGKDGVLALLRAQGFTLERVGGDPPATGEPAPAKKAEPAGAGRGK